MSGQRRGVVRKGGNLVWKKNASSNCGDIAVSLIDCALGRFIRR